MNFKLKKTNKKTHASWEMRSFIAILTHDKGSYRLKVTAPSRDAAFSQIMLSENCPKRAIKLYNYTGGPDAKTNPKGMGNSK